MKHLLFLLVLTFVLVINAMATNNCLSFNGTNAYVDCGNVSKYQIASNITVEAWVKLNSTVAIQTVVSRYRHDASSGGYELRVNDGGLNLTPGKVSFIMGRGWNDWWCVVSTATLSTGVWYHIAATFDGQYMKMYINGSLDNTVDLGTTKTATEPTGYGLNIGQSVAGVSTYFNGYIDEVRLWNAVRTVTQINDNKSVELAGNEANLVLYYKMNEGSGTTLNDNQTNTTTQSGAQLIMQPGQVKIHFQ